MDSTLRKIVLEMGAEALKDLIRIIKARPDVVAIDLTMSEDVAMMDKYYNANREALAGVTDEPV